MTALSSLQTHITPPRTSTGAEHNMARKALLVTLKISEWTARKLDKRETAEVAIRHSTSQECVRVNKSLLPGAKELEELHKKTGEIRTEFYKLTLPWGENGQRIIPVDAYQDFMLKVSPMMEKWRRLADDFLAAYPYLRQRAYHQLGTLYRDEDYPSIDQITQRFNIDVNFSSVPDAADWRVDLSEDEVASLRTKLSKQIGEAQETAMKDLWDRLHNVVTRAVERLSQPDAIFRDTLVENAVELCGILPKMNLTGDPRLEEMRREVEQALCSKSPDDLRSKADLRASTAKRLAGISARFGAFYGEGV